MDDKRLHTKIRSSHFGQDRKDLLNSFVKNRTPDHIQQLQAQSNRTLEALIQKKRYQESDDILKNNIKVKDKNNQIFGVIDEVSSKDGIGKVKAISASDFETLMFNKQPKEFGEINALMHYSGVKKGYVHYVNEDNPFMSKTIRFKYDFNKFENDLSEVKKVQSFVDKNKLGVYESKLGTATLTNAENYAENFIKLKELKSQSIVQSALKSNNPFLRNMRRESRPLIEGLEHGWFGKMRSLFTSFGSPFRLGDYASISSLTDKDLSDVFDNQFGLDIETFGLEAKRNSVFQVGMKTDKDYKSLFLKQNQGFDLKKHEFLSNTGIGKINANNPIDFTKTQRLRDYTNGRLGLPVEAQVIEGINLKAELESFLRSAKEKKKNIILQNANFEIKHLGTAFGESRTLNFSEEYLKMRKESAIEKRLIKNKLATNRITQEEAFSLLVANQKKRFTQVMGEASHGSGALIEMQEISKTLNAVAQERGLIPKTGNFSVGTSVDFLSKIFMNESEIHEALSDISQQNLIAKKTTTFIRDIESGNFNLATAPEWQKNFINTWNNKIQDIHYDATKKRIISELETNGNLNRILPKNDIELISNSPINNSEMFEKALKELGTESSKVNTFLKSNKAIEETASALKKVKVGSLVLGGLLLGGAITNLFRFSGRDDDANSIEGLQHGPVQSQRRGNTAFGSGYRMEKFHNQNQGQDPEGMQWGSLATTGLGVGAFATFKNKKIGRRLNDITYLGALGQGVDNESLLKRSQATVQDYLVGGIRRGEAAFGGFPRAFGIGDVLSFGMYDSAEFTVDLTTQAGETYAKYMDQILRRKISQEGISSIHYKGGELFLHGEKGIEKVAGNFSLMKTVTDYNQNKHVSSLAKSQLYSNGINRLDHMAEQPFLILGGKKDWEAAKQFSNAFIHESLSKPMKLLADPLEGLREIIPNVDKVLPEWAKRTLGPNGIAKYVNVGLDGKELIKTWPEMLKAHGMKMAGMGALLYYGLGTVNWATKQVAPEDSPAGQAGLFGLGGSAIRAAHETYARFSDILGLTALRDKVEEMAPGMEGWQSTLGLTLSGAMFGGLYATMQDLAKEGVAADKYSQFLKNAEKTEKIDGLLGKVFKGEMTNASKGMKIGGAIGFALALPFTLAGFGADKSAKELEDEYTGKKEVAVKKGRFWESSLTPWSGGEIEYYRPNWYAKMMADAKNEELYGGNISPLGKTVRTLVDPYWLEKRRYNDQPYPVTGPDGSMFGIFGPVYESTIGRVIKPVALMHESQTPDELKKNTEYDLDAQLRKQWNSTLEFMGLRGFMVKAVKENLTGSGEIFADPNEARSAKDIDSVVKDFYDLQIGGGILTTEALRRVFQDQGSFQKAQMNAAINLNPIRNNMPSWMPKELRQGDPFLKVKDGYLRLPGAGFATRYEDLEGVDPEHYSDIYKYKILSDIAYGSQEFRSVRGKLQGRELTEFEQNIFDQVEQQIQEKKDSQLNIRDPKMYDTFLGRYSAFVTDLARSNPLETLLPFSPAHKFLPGPDIEDYIDEQKYAKDYRSWSSPISDFVMPTVSMTMHNLGLGGFSVNDESQIQAYQDKVNYVNYSNKAREAQSKGDLKTADEYTQAAQRTYSGSNLFSHHSEVSKRLPYGERKIFTHFSKSDLGTKRQMLERIDGPYRDAYEAQYNMHLQEEASRNHRISEHKRAQLMKQVRESRSSINARRTASIQDFTKKVDPKTFNSQARDYHNHTPRRNQYKISMPDQEINGANEYSSHYSELNKAGIKNSLVVIRPGLDNNVNANIQLDRTEESDRQLRNWGYMV